MISHRTQSLIFFLLFLLYSSHAARSFPEEISAEYQEAPIYMNGDQCQENQLVHIAMTLDSKYLRGSLASIHSIVKHSSCPENIHFHLIASSSEFSNLNKIVNFVFPSIRVEIYPFGYESRVKKLISSSIRPALDAPLNYARIYLGQILDLSVTRVIYLDSDTIVVDDIGKLFSIELTGSKVIGAPEYCHVEFQRYFKNEFWADEILSSVFTGKKACYFNTGVMVMDLERWREGDYTREIEEWMIMQKEKRIYELGSLPPFLLVFGGEIESIDLRWNQHGLGGDNVENSCRSLHPGPVSLLHWSGKGKPWVRIDEGRPCRVDRLWVPYDLRRTFRLS